MAVSRSISASVTLFGLLALILFSAPRSTAQAAPSFSQGAGTHAATTAATNAGITTGAVPTGSVQPPTGPVRPPTGTVPIAPSGNVPRSEGTHIHHDGEHHHHSDAGVGPIFYPVPIPYAVDLGGGNAYTDADADDQDPNYQGGPTVFDRRGSGADSYVAPVSDVSAPQNQDEDRAADPDPPQPTTLVFKDGHKLNVENYAIIGATLLDLTPGHTRRVPLADLDLTATRQENDDRGIVFQVPQIQQVN